MNTNRNDPFQQKQSPFAAPRPIQSGSVPLPKLPVPKPRNEEEAPSGLQLPPVPSVQRAPSLPQVPGLRKAGALFPEPVVEEYVEVEDDELEDEEEVVSDEEFYFELFGEEMPEGFDLDAEVSDEEDNYIAKKFEAEATPAATPTLYALANDPDWTIRNGVALNEDAAAPLLDHLSKDESSYVRESVMEHPNCPENTYRAFVNDEDELLVAAFIANERTTEDMLVPLYSTEDPFLGDELVASPLVPASVKAQLKSRLSL